MPGCDPEKRVLGSWKVVAVDGVRPNAAVPLRVAFPAGAYGPVILLEGQMWKEYTLASLLLELALDGGFRERTSESTSSAVTRSTYIRTSYAPLFGGELIREDGQPGTHEMVGTWTLAGDSLALFVNREAALADAAAHLKEIMPAASEAEIRETLDHALPQDVPLRWSGALRGDGLELRDAEGRVFTFRKAAAGGAE